MWLCGRIITIWLYVHVHNLLPHDVMPLPHARLGVDEECIASHLSEQTLEHCLISIDTI